MALADDISRMLNWVGISQAEVNGVSTGIMRTGPLVSRPRNL